MIASIVVQRPAAARQLFVLFHGDDADAAALAPLGRRLAAAFPEGFVVVQPAPAAMTDFLAAVSHWQALAGVAAEATALVGFARGAAMVLEATKADLEYYIEVTGTGGVKLLFPPTAPALNQSVVVADGK